MILPGTKRRAKEIPVMPGHTEGPPPPVGEPETPKKLWEQQDTSAVTTISSNTKDLGDGSTDMVSSSEEPTRTFNRNVPDEVLKRYRRSQANALFDSGALQILESLASSSRVPLTELHKSFPSPDHWAKFGVLMQAYFVEVIGQDARVTPEGRIALKKLDDFTKAFTAHLNET